MIAVHRAARDEDDAGISAKVGVTFEPGQGRRALLLLARLTLSVLLDVRRVEEAAK